MNEVTTEIKITIGAVADAMKVIHKTMLSTAPGASNIIGENNANNKLIGNITQNITLITIIAILIILFFPKFINFCLLNNYICILNSTLKKMCQINS
jgi:undecaprenyl pyrophosphate phosphatase UppP